MCMHSYMYVCAVCLYISVCSAEVGMYVRTYCVQAWTLELLQRRLEKKEPFLEK